MKPNSDRYKSAFIWTAIAVLLAGAGLGVILFAVAAIKTNVRSESQPSNPLGSSEYRAASQKLSAIESRFDDYSKNDRWAGMDSNNRRKEYNWMIKNVRELRESTESAIENLATPVSTRISIMEATAIAGSVVALLGLILNVALGLIDRHRKLELQQLKGVLADTQRKLAEKEEQARKGSPPEKVVAPAT